MIVFLAFRNVIRLWKRYFFVALAVALGFSLATLVSGSAFGALEAMKGKAARYFAGEVSVQGFPDALKAHQRIEDSYRLAEEIGRGVKGIRLAVPRNIYYGDDAILLFGGETVRQRRLAGIDFKREDVELSRLAFIEGGLEELRRDEADKGVLISEAAARILGAHAGDDVTLSLLTDRGQHNTGTLVVRGIFRETSLFGYIAYLPLATLNGLTARPSGSATDIAIYGQGGADPTQLATRVRAYLGRSFKVLPALPTKDDIDAALNAGVSGQTFAVLPLEGNLTQMRELVAAFLVITYLALVIFVAIVMIGILNTFRLIAYERTREVGTLRAIGMQRPAVLALFVMEAFFMAVASIIAGVLFCLVGFGLLSLVDLGNIPAAGLFTAQGRLVFHIDLPTTVADFGIMVAATMAAAFGPARQASRVEPTDALRMEA